MIVIKRWMSLGVGRSDGHDGINSTELLLPGEFDAMIMGSYLFATWPQDFISSHDTNSLQPRTGTVTATKTNEKSYIQTTGTHDDRPARLL
jgi:hypothetical protein